MKLRDKTLISLGFSIVTLGFLLYFFTHWVFLDSYNQIDEGRTYGKLRCMDLYLDRNLDRIAALCKDYAIRVAQTRQRSAGAGLPNAVNTRILAAHGLDFMALAERDGGDASIVYADEADDEWRVQAVADMESYLQANQLDGDDVAGFLEIGGRMFMLGICPLPSQSGGEGDSYLVAASELNDEFLEQTGVLIACGDKVQSVKIRHPNQSYLDRMHAQGPKWIEKRGEQTNVAVRAVMDLYGDPLFFYEIPVLRESLLQGRAVLGYFICFLLLSGLVLGLIIVILMERNFFARLSRLGRRLTKIGMEGDLSERVEDTGNDEISRLVRDIDSMLLALQRSAKELYGSEHRFKELFNNIQSGVAVYSRNDSSGEFILENVNVTGQNLDGLREDRVRGRSLLSIYPELATSEFYQAIQRVWEEGGSLHLGPRKFEEGRMRGWREFQIYKLPSEKIVVLYEDVTEREEAGQALNQKEQELHQSQKMEAIGRLAGGIAHDFNNILTVVNGVSEIMLMTMDEDDPKRPDLEEINSAGERAADLTEQLLAFSRKQIMKPEILDMNDAVEKTRQMLNRLIGEDIELKIEKNADSPVTKADSGQMQQVFMNLAVNSRDAMPHGGVLSISTSICQLTGEYIAKNVIMESVIPQSGDYVVVEIKDTGMGMDADTLEKICDPFFTTKGESKGTGLGLSTSYGIIRQSNGYMWFESEPGKGTKCTICLPSISRQGLIADEKDADVRLLSGSETILFVEDEEGLRKVTKRFLDYAGFKVLTAENAREALDVAAGHIDEIDLLLTDVIMPGGMNGTDLRDQIVAMKKDVKVVFITGYSNNLVVRKYIDERKDVVVKKPFSMSDLVRNIRDVLDDDDLSG